MANNKVVLVTGSAKRIGRKMCETLHSANYDVVIHYNQSENEANQLAFELNQIRPDSAVAIQYDLNDIKNLSSFADHVKACFGRLDLLINNASQFYPTEFSSASLENWNELFASNVQAPFFLIQQLKDELESRKGNIINMVDIHAEKPLNGYNIYCMAKAALVSLTKSLSDELAPNIRVNGIAPGPILWHDNPMSEQDKLQVLNEVSLNRLGSPEDIAQGALYLSEASFVTGHILKIDGGRSIKGSQKA